MQHCWCILVTISILLRHGSRVKLSSGNNKMSCNATCSSNSITLNWSTLNAANCPNVSEIDCYIVMYRIRGSTKFSIQQIYDQSKHSTLLDGLKSDTEYEIKVCVSVDGDHTPLSKMNVRTEISKSRALIMLSDKKNQDGENLDIYQMKPEIITKLAEHVRCCNMISGYDENDHREKTIMFFGETGSGKSTLIDALFNYITEISLGDDYRFKLVPLANKGSQTESQTNDITCYRIPRMNSFKLNHQLCVIDTPGFNNTQGFAFDRKISEMVKNLFQRGIAGLDALCLVVNSARVRITHRESYVFSSILELFAKDITENIFLFLTHDDGVDGKPPILGSLNKIDIPIKTDMYFRFENANLFKIKPFKEVWRANNNNFSSFFDKLMTTTTVSLYRTTSVLDSKVFLRLQIEKIRKTISNLCTDIQNIKQDKRKIAAHEQDRENYKNFTKTYQVEVLIQVSQNYESLNCMRCNETCHENCSVFSERLIWTCEVMTSFKCCICRGRCSTDYHSMRRFTYKTKTETRTEIFHELKAKYETAKQGAADCTEMMIRNKTRLKNSLGELDIILKQAEKNIMKLQHVALRPNFKCMEDFLNEIIASEKTPPVHENVHERVRILTIIRDHWFSNVPLISLMKYF